MRFTSREQILGIWSARAGGLGNVDCGFNLITLHKCTLSFKILFYVLHLLGVTLTFSTTREINSMVQFQLYGLPIMTKQ